KKIYNLRLKVFDKKILYILVKGRKKVKFDIPFDSFDSISSIKSGSQTVVNRNEESYRTSIYIRLYPKKEGIIEIPVKNDFLGEDFILKINVLKGRVTFEDIIKEIGFESYVKPGMLKEEIIKRFGEPKTKSIAFKDGFQVYYYSFDEYDIGYQILLKNNSVYDYKRYNK
ncbi:MAG: hypothetical protein JW983_09710, partial [Elusimicrobia bacterium]|nr:hypothetical protein [Elusimicrobiota bacterium]